MAKTNKEITTRRRRYLYVRRRFTPIYNRPSNNYFFCKFMMPFKLRPLQSNSGRYQFDFLATNDPSQTNFDLMDYIKSCPEYVPYIQLFNEVQLLNIAIKTTPIPVSTITNLNNVAIGWSFEQVGEPLHANIMVLNPCTSQWRYIRNFNRIWVPSDQSVSIIQKGQDMTFRLSTNSQTSDQSDSAYRWTIEVYLYMRFRKNTTLAS